jgi:bacillithiol synthase
MWYDVREPACRRALSICMDTTVWGLCTVKWFKTQLPTGNKLADLHTFSFEQVGHLFDGNNPSRLDTYRTRRDQLMGLHARDHRAKLVNAIRPMMQTLGATDASLAQLERLRDERTLAVVTGQQSGLFGGPMYSIYKALTAVGLAERLERELGCPVVPVFWVASEDHDWDEVNHTYVIDSDDAVRRIGLNLHAEPHAMVYHQPLSDDAVRQAISALHRMLPHGPTALSCIQELQSAFRPGMSLSTWFVALMQSWLGDRGIVFYDPCLPKLRDLAAPVWESAITRMDQVSASLDQVYDEVQSLDFQLEVMRDEKNTNLFAVRSGKRYVLERTDHPDMLRARGLGETKSVSDWLAESQEQPQAFSSNVLMRPVVQDFILPTLCYVGGPSEIAYYPLSRGVFHALGRSLPPLVLRQRGVIYPPSVLRAMTRHQIDKGRLRTQVSLLKDYVDEAGGAALDTAAEGIRALVEAQWSNWMTQFAEIGPQIEDVAMKSRQRVVRELARMTSKAKRLVAVRDAATINQLAEIERWIWTDGHLQERRLSPVSLIGRFGLTWLRELPAWGEYDEPGVVYEMDLE